MAVVLVAALTRIWIATSTPTTEPFLDMAEYWERGVHVWQHGTLYPDSWRLPGLPVALAGGFLLAGGPSMTAARAINVVAGTLAALLTYRLSRHTAAPRPALAAGLVVAVYPSFLAYTVLTATETIVTVPLMAALLAATRASRPWLAVAGALAAVAALIRPPGLVALPAVVVAALWFAAPHATRTKRVATALVPVVTFLLVMTPWWVSTYRRHGQVVPFDTTGGFNLLLGNGPHATGHLRTASTLETTGGEPPGHAQSSPDGDRRLRQQALAYVAAHPWRTLALLPRKLGALFALEGREHAYLYSVGLYGELSPLALRLWGLAVMASFAVLAAAAALGLCAPRGVAAPVAVPILVVLAAGTTLHLVTFGDPRFHLPFVPMLAVLATGLARLDAASPRRVTVAAVAIGVMAVPWYTQARTYLGALDELARPGGSTRPLDYDALL